MFRGHRVHVSVRSLFSPGDEGAGADPRRARSAHGVQFARAAHQSRGAALPSDRCVRRGDRAAHGADLGRDADRARVGRAWRRGLGRGDSDRPFHRFRRDARRDSPPRYRSARIRLVAVQIGGSRRRRCRGQFVGARCGIRCARPRSAPRGVDAAVRSRALHRRPRRFHCVRDRHRRRGDRQRPSAAMAAAVAAIRGAGEPHERLLG